MKKLIVLAIIMAVMVLVAALVHAQTPPNDLKPTFISPTPGLYVNGWPAFTVTYPKEWVEWPPVPSSVFCAGVSRPDLPADYVLPSLNVVVVPGFRPLEDWAKISMPIWVQYYADVKVLSDKPSRLKDGTPAREAEVEFVVKNGSRAKAFLLITKKDDAIIFIRVTPDKGRTGEDLKRIAYSLTFLQGREEPVNVPPDVQAFLDMWCADIVSHDVKAIMEHFSDRYLLYGTHKAFAEQYWRNDLTSPAQRGAISYEATVTVFYPRGDKAYVAGFFALRAKGDANAMKLPMIYQQIINEHGEWKWFGNQK